MPRMKFSALKNPGFVVTSSPSREIKVLRVVVAVSEHLRSLSYTTEEVEKRRLAKPSPTLHVAKDFLEVQPGVVVLHKGFAGGGHWYE